MKFLNRIEELDRLDRLATSADGGLAVVYGRRRRELVPRARTAPELIPPVEIL